jgi:hypothetical protein
MCGEQHRSLDILGEYLHLGVFLLIFEVANLDKKVLHTYIYKLGKAQENTVQPSPNGK